MLINNELASFENERADLVSRVKNAEKEHIDQLQGRAGAPPGDGKLSKALEKIKDNLVTELNNLDEKNKTRILELTQKKQNLIAEMDAELNKNKIVSAGLDGLLERIKLAHKIAGFWISLFITLLFLAIELTPIFFKLMLIKSPYDFLKNNVEELLKAEEGIYIQYNYHKDKTGQERDLIKHLKSEKLLVEQRALLNTQEELTEYAISKYKEEMKKRIDENPEAFIKANGYDNKAS